MKMRKVGMGVLVLAMFMIVIAGAGKPWFDMENCDFCKNLTAEKGLMDHITKWEHHNVKNGAMTISVVDKGYIPAYKRAMAKMEEVGKRMEAGEKVTTCGMCDAYSAVFMQGAQWDVIETDNIFVTIMWSDKPEVVTDIHKMVDHTNKEMAMMEKMKDSHKEHGH